MKTLKQRAGILAAGFALFSMFFGAGDLLWPMILGGNSGDKNFYSLMGLLISGVSLPLLGLLAMMLFNGDFRAFFGKIGRVPGAILIFVIQAILGPIGSIPRLITLSYATLQGFLPSGLGLAAFSVLASCVVFLFVVKKQRLVDILGYVLTPLLLLSLILIFVMGFANLPAAPVVPLSHKEAFFGGLSVGYNTLDLIASFIFAPVVLCYFHREDDPSLSPKQNQKRLFGQMLQSCLLAAFLLAGMYVGLSMLSASYTPLLTPGHAPEERLGEIARYLLGGPGALIACIGVVLSCLTTAISITVIVSDYIHKDLLKERTNLLIPTIITLGISSVLANLGFMGIADMLSPLLQIVCPGLIVLSVLNIFHKLYEMRIRRAPIYIAFALSLIGYFLPI